MAGAAIMAHLCKGRTIKHYYRYKNGKITMYCGLIKEDHKAQGTAWFICEGPADCKTCLRSYESYLKKVINNVRGHKHSKKI